MRLVRTVFAFLAVLLFAIGKPEAQQVQLASVDTLPAQAVTAVARHLAATNGLRFNAFRNNTSSTTKLSRPETGLIALAPKGYNVSTEIQVDADEPTQGATEGYLKTVTRQQIELSAGTFGDPSRYLQSLAGVVSDNDQRNDFLVRGGNPEENLFLIDNIEVPSINQLALSDTTGGFVSMLDNQAVQRMTIHTDAYDDRFDQRLSSIVDISTRTTGPVQPLTVTEAGIYGVGGSITRPLGIDGSYFVSVRESVLQYITNDIGLNGVPHYRNLFLRAQGRSNGRDTWWAISLTGIDSIAIRPSFTDYQETNPYNINYSGWRNTTGINWQHEFSPRSVGILSLANAQQSQTIAEDAQQQNDALVYNEQTSDGISTLKYDWTFQPAQWFTLSTGGRAAVDRLHYAVAQPLGLQNPYSADPAPVDAMGLQRRFATASTGAYLQGMFRLPRRSTLTLGERAEQWALGGHAGTTGKALFSVPLGNHAFHIGFADYQQLPATLYLLSFNNIAALRPIRSRQLTTGIELHDGPRARITLQAYQKRYFDYPVATEYPQLSLANIADTFGTAFLLFPMTGSGTGLGRGVELTLETRATPRITLTTTLTYARSWYAGLDTVLRRGNYDIPFVLNFSGVRNLGRASTLSWKYRRSSGLPFTPDDLALSYAQNRDVYDLTRINAVRSQRYQRLDLRFEQNYRLGPRTLTWYAGLENALNNDNFYANLWQHNIGGDAAQTQMPRFPDGGMKLTF